MITKYTAYIKEQIEIDYVYNVRDFQSKLNYLIEELNKEFYKNIFEITNYTNKLVNTISFSINTYYTIFISYSNYINDFDFSFNIHLTNHIKRNSKTIKNFNDVLIYINNNLILNFLEYLFNESFNNITQFYKYCELECNSNYFLKCLLNKTLPRYIQDKYNYLNKANNFDLI